MNRPVSWSTHLPALTLLVTIAVILWFGSPWPAPVPDGWDGQGRPIHWQSTPAGLGAALTIWLVWFALDGAWAVVERKRTLFNPLALIDEAVIAWILVRLANVGVALGLPPFLRPAAWAAGGVALAAAVALELRRQAAPSPEPPVRQPGDASDLASLSEWQRQGRRWSYWSEQRTPHRLLFATLGAVLVLGAVAIPAAPFVARLLLLVGGLLVLAVCGGGLRAVVTPRQLVLRAGYFGVPLLRLTTTTTAIVEVSVPDFDPLRDFGGWGFRRGLCGEFAGVWSFNLARAGVLVRTREGRGYLIGSDRPERLAAALNAARRAA